TSCWTRTPKLLTYRDEAGTSDGLQHLDLRPGAAGSARIKLRARGANLARPTLPASLPLVLQLQSDQGGCWESRFDARRTHGVAAREARELLQHLVDEIALGHARLTRDGDPGRGRRARRGSRGRRR